MVLPARLIHEKPAGHVNLADRGPVAAMDETSWKEGRRKAYVWTAVTATFTVFVIRLSRAKHVAQELLRVAQPAELFGVAVHKEGIRGSGDQVIRQCGFP